jgi:demethylmenaquinone methyltransferase/2-methoxy-6-polyprenyl-1,4-benzoquinol methylase
MFNQVPRRYDLLNRLLTLRLDESWRRRAARACLENQPARVLDLCTGTGDLAISIARRANYSIELTGLDFSAPMLEIAREKTTRKALTTVDYLLGDASSMPFPNRHFGTVGIAFAFRNLTYHNPLKDKSLKEVYRVLEDGGRFVIIESSQPGPALLRQFWLGYIRYIVKPIGSWISGHPGAYHYLAHSVRNYYAPEEIRDMLLACGFRRVEYQTILGGVAALHVAHK